MALTGGTNSPYLYLQSAVPYRLSFAGKRTSNTLLLVCRDYRIGAESNIVEWGAKVESIWAMNHAGEERRIGVND